MRSLRTFLQLAALLPHQFRLRPAGDVNEKAGIPGIGNHRDADHYAAGIVDALDETIDGLEERVLQRADGGIPQQIMMVRRNLLRVRRATLPQREIMNRLSRGEFPKLIRQEAAIYFRDIYDHLVRVEYLVESLRDLADGALNTYLSVVSNRLNEVMKVLTAAATVFLPLTLISGVYGMNFSHNQFPGFEEPWGFPVVAGTMVAIAVALLGYFRYRRWI